MAAFHLCHAGHCLRREDSGAHMLEFVTSKDLFHLLQSLVETTSGGREWQMRSCKGHTSAPHLPILPPLTDRTQAMKPILQKVPGLVRKRLPCCMLSKRGGGDLGGSPSPILGEFAAWRWLPSKVGAASPELMPRFSLPCSFAQLLPSPGGPGSG